MAFPSSNLITTLRLLRNLNRMPAPNARSKYPRAQFTLGLLCDMGSIGRMDKKRAVQWYRKAADQGLPQAQYDMGVLSKGGDR